MAGKIKDTYSVCPVCGRTLPAALLENEGKIEIVRVCPEHGRSSARVWNGRVNFDFWTKGHEVKMQHEPPCPEGCGLCESHLRGTCCLLYEVTKRCNLHCKFCFADPDGSKDKELKEIYHELQSISEEKKPLLQLSGGEPTVRDDLPEIVGKAVELGFPYVQINTNGIRLAQEEEYVKRLADAGLSIVFLQFDGVDDRIYRELRGRDLLELKKQAIKNCGKYRIGVTLVPTLVPGVNTDQAGSILRYAVSGAPYVRGVHYQPVSWFGRYEQAPADEERYTLDRLIDDLREQAEDIFLADDLEPSHCDHPLCGFHGSFLVQDDGTLKPQARKAEAGDCCCGTGEVQSAVVGPCCAEESGQYEEERCCAESDGVISSDSSFSDISAEQNREYIGRRWTLTKEEPEPDTLDAFLKEYRERTFTITSMAFQDCYNLNLERLMQCSLHVYRDGKTIPFCANYLTLADGRGFFGQRTEI